MKAKYYRREWLNAEEAAAGDTAFIFAELGNSKGYEPSEIIIADCTRQITLDFHISSGDSSVKYNNDQEAKIDLLYEVIGEFRREFKKELRKVRKASEASE